MIRSCLLLFSCLLLAAPVAQAGAVNVEVLLAKGQPKTQAAEKASTWVSKSLAAQGLRVSVGAKNPDYLVRLMVRLEMARDKKLSSFSVLLKAYEPGTSAMAGLTTGMADPFTSNDVKATEAALKVASEQAAEKIAKQLKQAAAHQSKAGKRYQIRLNNMPSGAARAAKRVLMQSCKRVKTGMISQDQASFRCLTRQGLPELESAIKASLAKKLPGKPFKTTSFGSAVVVTFE